MSEPIAVNILDREYLIGAPAEERTSLLAAAAYLDEKLRALRSGANRGGGLDRIAILAALNIAHELLNVKQCTEAGSEDMARQLQAIKSKLDAGLPASLQ